jgi:hypothetical protein
LLIYSIYIPLLNEEGTSKIRNPNNLLVISVTLEPLTIICQKLFSMEAADELDREEERLILNWTYSNLIAKFLSKCRSRNDR